MADKITLGYFEIGAVLTEEETNFKDGNLFQFAPVWKESAAPPGWAHDFNGVPNANIAKINGVPIADIAKVNGVS